MPIKPIMNESAATSRNSFTLGLVYPIHDETMSCNQTHDSLIVLINGLGLGLLKILRGPYLFIKVIKVSCI